MNLQFKLELKPEHKAQIRKGFTPQDGVDMLQVIDDELCGRSGNFAKVFVNSQSKWKPLNREYLQHKIHTGRGRLKWIYDHHSVDALTNPAKLTTAGGESGARKVRILANSGGKATMQWIIEAPAAGGYFRKNNRIRRWVSEKLVPEESAQKILRGLIIVANRILARMGFDTEFKGRVKRT